MTLDGELPKTGLSLSLNNRGRDKGGILMSGRRKSERGCKMHMRHFCNMGAWRYKRCEIKISQISIIYFNCFQIFDGKRRSEVNLYSVRVSADSLNIPSSKLRYPILQLGFPIDYYKHSL